MTSEPLSELHSLPCCTNSESLEVGSRELTLTKSSHILPFHFISAQGGKNSYYEGSFCIFSEITNRRVCFIEKLMNKVFKKQNESLLTC